MVRIIIAGALAICSALEMDAFEAGHHRRIVWRSIRVCHDNGALVVYPLHGNHRLATLYRQQPRHDFFREFKKNHPLPNKQDVATYRKAILCLPDATDGEPQSDEAESNALSIPQDNVGSAGTGTKGKEDDFLGDSF
ncbi:MAG: hypothetical protein LBR89_02570 [Holosporales bacterium]|jgi:hypothetical protein|nr:hypothetical protein [Holosporales bacterium]